MNKRGSITLIIIVIFSALISASAGVLVSNHYAKISMEQQLKENELLYSSHLKLQNILDKEIKENREVYSLISSITGIEILNSEDLKNAIDLINIQYANLLYYETLNRIELEKIEDKKEVVIRSGGGGSSIIPPISPPVY